MLLQLSINFATFTKIYGISYPVGKLPVQPKALANNFINTENVKCCIATTDKDLIVKLINDNKVVGIGINRRNRKVRANKYIPNVILFRGDFSKFCLDEQIIEQEACKVEQAFKKEKAILINL